VSAVFLVPVPFHHLLGRNWHEKERDKLDVLKRHVVVDDDERVNLFKAELHVREIKVALILSHLKINFVI
jgi:hypothetical protein